MVASTFSAAHKDLANNIKAVQAISKSSFKEKWNLDAPGFLDFSRGIKSFFETCNFSEDLLAFLKVDYWKVTNMCDTTAELNGNVEWSEDNPEGMLVVNNVITKTDNKMIALGLAQNAFTETAMASIDNIPAIAGKGLQILVHIIETYGKPSTTTMEVGLNKLIIMKVERGENPSAKLNAIQSIVLKELKLEGNSHITIMMMQRACNNLAAYVHVLRNIREGNPMKLQVSGVRNQLIQAYHDHQSRFEQSRIDAKAKGNGNNGNGNGGNNSNHGAGRGNGGGGRNGNNAGRGGGRNGNGGRGGYGGRGYQGNNNRYGANGGIHKPQADNHQIAAAAGYQQNKGKTTFCKFCKGYVQDHTQQSCPKGFKINGQKDAVCFNCGSPDHYSNKCPEKKPNNGVNSGR